MYQMSQPIDQIKIQNPTFENNHGYQTSQQNPNQLRPEIERISSVLSDKYGQQNLQHNIKKAFQLYSSGYIPSDSLSLIDSQLQVRYPDTPKEQIISLLYHKYQSHMKLIEDLQETDFIVEYMKELNPHMDPIQAIDSLHQYLTWQDDIPLSQRPNTSQKSYISPAYLKKIKPDQEEQAVGDFYDDLEEDDEDVEFFEGKVVQKGIQMLKKKMSSFLNQRKIVHVYSKKGYGLEAYRQHLEKRKLDKKEWEFYQKELVQNRNYDFYLSSAIHSTLHIIIDFVRNLKNEKYIKYPFSSTIKQEQFEIILNSIYQMEPPLNRYLSDCMRVVHGLKIQHKLHYTKVHELLEKITEIRTQNMKLLKKRIQVQQEMTSKKWNFGENVQLEHSEEF